VGDYGGLYHKEGWVRATWVFSPEICRVARRDSNPKSQHLEVNDRMGESIREMAGGNVSAKGHVASCLADNCYSGDVLRDTSAVPNGGPCHRVYSHEITEAKETFDAWTHGSVEAAGRASAVILRIEEKDNC
jgi:hypothetical protein